MAVVVVMTTLMVLDDHGHGTSKRRVLGLQAAGCRAWNVSRRSQPASQLSECASLYKGTGHG